MMRPEEYRWIACQWRNIAGAAEAQVEYMRGAGLSGCVVLMADLAISHAKGVAESLEERAAEIERMRGPL